VSFVDSLYPLVITGDAVGARDLLLGLEGKELIEAHRSGPAPLPLGRGEPDHGALRGRTVWASDRCEARAMGSLLAVKVLRRNPRLADAQKLASSGGAARASTSSLCCSTVRRRVPIGHLRDFPSTSRTELAGRAVDNAPARGGGLATLGACAPPGHGLCPPNPSHGRCSSRPE